MEILKTGSFWEKVHFIISIVVGYILFLIGDINNLMRLLIIFMIINFFTGVINSKLQGKKIESQIMLESGYSNILIFVIIMVGNLIDITFQDMFLRQTIIMFYIIEKGISILENVEKYIDLPPQIRKFFNNLDKGEDKID